MEGAAFCLILGLGACTDGLTEVSGGMAVLVGGVAVSALLVHLAHSRAWDREQTEARKGKQRGQLVPLRRDKQRLVQGKKKAAEVVATPQRRVKQSSKVNISRPYFTGAEGVCQVWIGKQRGENRSLSG